MRTRRDAYKTEQVGKGVSHNPRQKEENEKHNDIDEQTGNDANALAMTKLIVVFYELVRLTFISGAMN